MNAVIKSDPDANSYENYLLQAINNDSVSPFISINTSMGRLPNTKPAKNSYGNFTNRVNGSLVHKTFENNYASYHHTQHYELENGRNTGTASSSLDNGIDSSSHRPNSVEDGLSTPEHCANNIPTQGNEGGIGNFWNNKEFFIEAVKNRDPRLTFLRKEGPNLKSVIWTAFSVIYFDGVLTNFVKCDRCHHVYKYDRRTTGTSTLNRHPCIRYTILGLSPPENPNSNANPDSGLKRYACYNNAPDPVRSDSCHSMRNTILYNAAQNGSEAPTLVPLHKSHHHHRGSYPGDRRAGKVSPQAPSPRYNLWDKSPPPPPNTSDSNDESQDGCADGFNYMRDLMNAANIGHPWSSADGMDLALNPHESPNDRFNKRLNNWALNHLLSNMSQHTNKQPPPPPPSNNLENDSHSPPTIHQKYDLAQLDRSKSNDLNDGSELKPVDHHHISNNAPEENTSIFWIKIAKLGLLEEFVNEIKSSIEDIKGEILEDMILNTTALHYKPSHKHTKNYYSAKKLSNIVNELNLMTKFKQKLSFHQNKIQYEKERVSREMNELKRKLEIQERQHQELFKRFKCFDELIELDIKPHDDVMRKICNSSPNNDGDNMRNGIDKSPTPDRHTNGKDHNDKMESGGLMRKNNFLGLEIKREERGVGSKAEGNDRREGSPNVSLSPSTARNEVSATLKDGAGPGTEGTEQTMTSHLKMALTSNERGGALYRKKVESLVRHFPKPTNDCDDVRDKDATDGDEDNRTNILMSLLLPIPNLVQIKGNDPSVTNGSSVKESFPLHITRGKVDEEDIST